MDDLKYLRLFWGGKRVLITGHTGFKGSWLIIFLNMLKAKIYGYSLKPKKNSLFKRCQLNKKIKENIYADIRNFKKLKKTINSVKPEIIFHLASQPLVSESFKDPRLTFDTNILGVVNLLDCLQKNKFTKSVVIITTDKVYKINKEKKYNENDEIGGLDPYSASKASKEIIVNSFVKSIFLNSKLVNRISTARSGNVIGGGDYSKNRLVPDIMSAIQYNKYLKIRNPNHIRPWQHVIEPLYGYLLLAQKLYLGKMKISNIAWNFGPSSKSFLKVKDLVILTKKLIRKKLTVKISRSRYIETKVLKLDNNKSKKYLNWNPKWGVKKALIKTLELEKKINSKTQIINTCENQIYNYLKE